jgi:hypothetical protein
VSIITYLDNHLTDKISVDELEADTPVSHLLQPRLQGSALHVTDADAAGSLDARATIMLKDKDDTLKRIAQGMRPGRRGFRYSGKTPGE